MTAYQKTKPAPKRPERELRAAALILDIVLFWPSAIVDFSNGAIYKPKKEFYVHLFVHKIVQLLTSTLSDFRKDIKSYFDRVTVSCDTLIINRGKDTGVIIMSLEEYNSLKLRAINYRRVKTNSV